MFEELTPERLKEIETRWKSDVDKKLDYVVKFIDEYGPMVKMLMEREIDRRALRKAIIEKTLAGLVWGAIVSIGALIWTGLKTEANDFTSFFKGGK